MDRFLKEYNQDKAVIVFLKKVEKILNIREYNIFLWSIGGINVDGVDFPEKITTKQMSIRLGVKEQKIKEIQRKILSKIKDNLNHEIEELNGIISNKKL